MPGPRIVSLVPGATEMVVALGLGDLLVGISHECDHPPSVQHLPRVTRSCLPSPQGAAPACGSPSRSDGAPAPGWDLAQIDAAVRQGLASGVPLYGVDVGRLEALRPDVIVTQGTCQVCAVHESQVTTEMTALPDRVLARAQVVSLAGADVEGVLADMDAIGRACGRDPAAALAPLRARWGEIAEAGAVLRDREGPLAVLALEWTDPPFSAGHWVPEQIERAGGSSALGRTGERSRSVEWSDVCAARPDAIVVMACGFDLTANVGFARELADDPRTRDIAAVRAGCVWAIDANAFTSRPGPRLIRGAELLHAMVAAELGRPPRWPASPGELLRVGAPLRAGASAHPRSDG